jgi:hypothetical protein
MGMRENKQDISFRDVVLSVRQWIKYLFSKWMIITSVAFIAGLIALFMALNSKPKYTATLTFVLSTETKVNSLSGLAGQFGLDFGGGSNDVFTGDNILTLLKSKRMIRRALFKSPPGTNDILANIVVKEWGWDKAWAKTDHLAKSFPFAADTALLTPVQDSLISEIRDIIVKSNLSVSRLDKKLSVFVVKTTSSNALFACYLTRFLMDESARFYIDTKTRIAKQNLLMLQKEADSLRGMLGQSISSTASGIDATYNLNPALQVQRAPIQKSQFNTSVLGTAYGEVVRNLELAKINLQREMPLYQIVDEPALPLKVERTSKLKALVIGGFVGGILIILLLVLYKMGKGEPVDKMIANQKRQPISAS